MIIVVPSHHGGHHHIGISGSGHRIVQSTSTNTVPFSSDAADNFEDTSSFTVFNEFTGFDRIVPASGDSDVGGSNSITPGEIPNVEIGFDDLGEIFN